MAIRPYPDQGTGGRGDFLGPGDQGTRGLGNQGTVTPSPRHPVPPSPPPPPPRLPVPPSPSRLLPQPPKDCLGPWCRFGEIQCSYSCWQPKNR
ncbi:MAG: hypothetical protein Fur0025_48600 [Oscillatoriaceae cyanobacterium]